MMVEIRKDMPEYMFYLDEEQQHMYQQHQQHQQTSRPDSPKTFSIDDLCPIHNLKLRYKKIDKKVPRQKQIQKLQSRFIPLNIIKGFTLHR